MLKLVGVALLAAALPATAQAAVLGPDAAACEHGDSAFLVRVDGFKSRTGNVRVQVYGSNPAEFLEKGKKLRRVDLPVTRSGPMDVCVAVPGPGNYAIAVRHDIDGSGKSGWNDGGGFSRNPKLSLLHLKPHYEDVVVPVGHGVRQIEVRLNYRNGLSIGPARAG